jgi:hypothetical protein
MYYTQQAHRSLPKNSRVIDATLALIHGGAPGLPTELPPREAGLLHRDVPAAVDVEAEQLRARLEEGTANEEDLYLLHLGL